MFCIGDDEDVCEDVDELGQGFVELGFVGGSSVLFCFRILLCDEGSSYVKRCVKVKYDSSKKWMLIVGIIVVVIVFVLFCVFVIWWFCKN